MDALKTVLITVAYVIVIFPGSIFVQRICGRLSLPKSEKDKPGLRGAGTYIGYFERFLVLTLIFLQQYEAIAFIFVGKSIARFSKTEEVEYYLVGTFSSISWAFLWGVIFKLFLGI